MADAIPITILTGFLGAGKTTLLNRLVRDPAFAGAAVLINEFGEVGLDHLLVQPLDPDTVLLEGGCLCCTVRGDLVRALRDLLPRIDAGAVRRVVIETTGLADPAPILRTLLADPIAATRYRTDGAVAVVDAVHAAAQLDTHEEAVRQVTMSDAMVLAKTDLVAPETVAQLRARLQRLNPSARIHEAVRGAVSADALLGLGLFDASGKMADVARWLAEAAASDHHHDGHHDHSHHLHDQRIAAFTVTFDRPVHWSGIGACLEMLIATRGESLLRVKGILDLVGEDRPLVIHAVQHLVHEPVLLPSWQTGEQRRSRIVFITRDLPRYVVEDGLRAFEQAARAA